jgi:hypothetical protein
MEISPASLPQISLAIRVPLSLSLTLTLTAHTPGMEPLVEVHTDREMEIALQAGAKVIGVNNRNLHTFKLDLDTTERAIGIAKKMGFTWELKPGGPVPDIMIAALSGITSSDDVAIFRKAGVSCVLVGETLMKSTNPKQTIAELLGEVPAEGDGSKRVLVKTCGVTSALDAEAALQAGANMIGKCDLFPCHCIDYLDTCEPLGCIGRAVQHSMSVGRLFISVTIAI